MAKKFKKTSPQDTSQTWQDKFKKPVWLQDKKIEEFVGSTKYVYKPINKFYSIKQIAVMLEESINVLGAHYFFKGRIILKEDGSLSVTGMGMTPASSYETTTIWDMTAEINVNGKIILKERFRYPNTVSLWPKDNFTLVGKVNLKLPSPVFNDKIKLILRGGYTLIIPEMGNANVTPLPPQTSKEFLLDLKMAFI